MTTYQVIAPIVIIRFKKEEDSFFSYVAWSPRRYGPIYSFDLIIEIENKDDYHPSMNTEYSEFLQRIFDHLDLDHEHLERKETSYGHFIDLYVDFHCPVPLENRSDHLYCTILNQQIFSPPFFNYEHLNQYLNQQQIYFPLLSRDLQSTIIEHKII